MQEFIGILIVASIVVADYLAIRYGGNDWIRQHIIDLEY